MMEQCLICKKKQNFKKTPAQIKYCNGDSEVDLNLEDFQ